MSMIFQKLKTGLRKNKPMETKIVPRLQILVPQYKETEDIIKPLLDSIAVQQRIDFERDISVIIVNDGTDVKLKRKWLDSYPYHIDYILAPHEGVSATRNRCFEHATADYVMWCDADDSFYTTHAIWQILQSIDVDKFDIMNSVFLEEVCYTDGRMAKLVKHENDRTFVHGKVYRRQYLIDNDIHWNPKLSIHEDLFFNTLALVSTKNIRYQDMAFYIWRSRKESVCREDPDYILKTYPNLIESNEELIKEFIKRGMADAAAQIMCFVTLDAYYTLQLPIWHTKEHVVYRDGAEKCYAALYSQYKKLFFDASIEYRKKTASGIRGRVVEQGMVMEIISFPDWMQHIESLVTEKTEQE